VIIERLGEASSLLHEVLTMLGAKVEDGQLVIPALAIRQTPNGVEVNVGHDYARLEHGEWKLPIIEQEPPR
jgi:hypothetical protein